MKLAIRALIAALAMLIICAAVSAQTIRSDKDPRNQSPSVGTGGPEGGPTGLFTIYDGSTIRRGEFTFSIAYSNYDRDPGDADFVDIPGSFNVGLNDHIEVFFKSNLYRGLKINSPTHLSGFYLPNVSLCSAIPPCTGPAIILSPTGPNVGTLAGNALFRPLNNQPFVQFPFIGGSAGTFGQGPGQIGSLFGFPGFQALIGGPIGTGGRNSGAAAFPGLGSPVGSILPGIVLATTTIPATALSLPIVVPTTFTIAPTYLPDAPFIGRQYGESSFTNYVAGAKIRFTGPHNPLGVGFIPFYRWYPDNADTPGGFNQLQRGAGPGGNFWRGDIGLIGFIDGRIHKHVNISVNAGPIFTSNEKSKAMGDVVILDRPNEFLVGIGLDFPVNKHFQPVAEVRQTIYFGSRTPNAFENKPVDLIGGVKIFPKRWWGFGVAYRRHMNEQDEGHIEKKDFQVTVGQVTNVFVPGRGQVIVTPNPITVAATTGGIPTGFRFSSDPNGFIIQFFAGHRNARVPPVINQPPTLTSVTASSSSIVRPCPPGTSSSSCPTTENFVLQLTAEATDPDNDVLVYSWTVTGGKITGEGKNVTWDLTGVQDGTYTATVQVSDGTHPPVSGSTTVTVGPCPNCEKPPCPTVNVSCPDSVDLGQPITFTASTSAPNVTYNWSVSAGTISSGQGTSSITVDSANLGGQTVTATVEVGGLDPSCSRTASCSTSVKAPPPKECEKVDEYGDIKFNDEKARLDTFASRLQTDAGSTGYIIGYGSCEGQGLARANRAKDYLVNTRGIDAGRINVIDGGCRAELLVQLYICPPGANAPTPMTDGAVSPCPECKAGRRRAPARRAPRHGKKKAGDDEE